jgi:hypothetical protein
MRKFFVFVMAALFVIVIMTCSTIYHLELISDDNQNRSVFAQYPNYINMLVRVTNGKITTTDPDGNLIPDFSNPDYYVVGLEPTVYGQSKGNFFVLENGIEVKVEAGLRVVPLEELELHINLLLDVSGSMGEVGLIQAKNAIKRLIARPCTESEIAANDPGCFNYRYIDWDDKSNSFVERNEVWKSILKENQIITIYTFSDTVKKLQLREFDDSGNRYNDKAQQLLDTIDKNIRLGVDSTNLYGALLAGLDDLSSIRMLNDPKQGFIDGIVIAFTDGSHTTGDIQYHGKTLTPKQAIQEILRLRGGLTDIQSLRVITIAVDSPELRVTIKEGDLAGGGLRDIQNAGYLWVDNYRKLKAKFIQAFELIDRYTRSLYWIYYRTPKTGIQTVDIELFVDCKRCETDPDGNIPLYAKIIESVQTTGFYHVLPGVYINDPILDEQGNLAQILDDNGDNIAVFGPERIKVVTNNETDIHKTRVYSLILANNPGDYVMNKSNTALLRIHTYVRANDNRFKPEYKITSSNESIVNVIGYASLTVIESVALIECLKKGTATIEVIDTANGNLRDTIIVESQID